MRLLAPLRTLPLPGPVACKFTVMRDKRPELYQHGLRRMIVAVFLGLKTGMPERDCATLAAAALLHDLGVLHMDPAWSDPDFKAVGVQRRHLVAHPITAMLMVRDTQAYPKAAEVAVLEHHERMDGNGYPRGLAGADISPTGRILMLARAGGAHQPGRCGCRQLVRLGNCAVVGPRRAKAMALPQPAGLCRTPLLAWDNQPP